LETEGDNQKQREIPSILAWRKQKIKYLKEKNGIFNAGVERRPRREVVGRPFNQHVGRRAIGGW
jgi:hypothetical protein